MQEETQTLHSSFQEELLQDAQNSSGNTADQSTIIEEMKIQIQQLEQALSASQDENVRAQANLMNALKRKDTEKDQAVRYGQTDFFKEFIFVLDSFDGAVISLQKTSGDHCEVVSGLKLIQEQMQQLLVKFHLEVLEPQPGDLFNPHIAEAMSIQSSQDHLDNSILYVVQKGYRLHDRVLRPARVIVVKNN